MATFPISGSAFSSPFRKDDTVNQLQGSQCRIVARGMLDRRSPAPRISKTGFPKLSRAELGNSNCEYESVPEEN